MLGAVVVAVGKGGGILGKETDWECARRADVHEGFLHVRDGDGFWAVPVDEAVFDGESFILSRIVRYMGIFQRRFIVDGGLLILSLVKVIFVEDKGVWKDVP